MKNTITLPLWQKDIYKELAVMELERLGRKANAKNIESMIQELVNETIHSYKPNPGGFIGSNPTPTMSEDVFKLSSQYMFEKNGVLSRFSKSDTEYAKHMKRYKAIMMSLTAFYMDLVLDVRREQKGTDLTDPAQVSPFQYKKKEGRVATDFERERFHEVNLMRYYRILVETVAASSLEPFFKMTATDLEEIIRMTGLPEQSTAVLRKKDTRHKFVRALTDVLGGFFGRVRIPDVLRKG